ncbi:hypothetical protein TWF506_005728 [Arthrobotrys conoides]|uniref:C2H2-type domain-containing protein n=1 Tax=Arthrobotrys conoides TaxID=74498 RepID=A0AAN8RQ26_9PEZI
MEDAASRILNSSRNISRGSSSQVPTEVEELLNSELPRAARRISGKKARQKELTGDFLTDSGDLITYVLELLDEVATTISDERRIRAYCDRKFANEDCLVDFDYVHHLEERHSALVNICKELKHTSTHINLIWENTFPKTQPVPRHHSRDIYSSSPERRRSSAQSSAHTQESPLGFSSYTIRDSSQILNQPGSYFHAPPLSPQRNNRQFTQNFSDIVDSEDHGEEEYERGYEEEEEEEEMPSYLQTYGDMEVDRSDTSYQVRRGPGPGSTPNSLSSPGSIDPGLDLDRRGVGEYTCSMGWNCTKGGVINDEIKVFKRNSDFRRHMQKHNRVYKCDYPGCSNPGFARPDHLNRHKEKVHKLFMN